MVHRNNRLSTLRGDRSQREFARGLGMSQQAYSKIESGVQPLKSDLIVRLCGMYGVSAEWLLGLTEDEGMYDLRNEGYRMTLREWTLLDTYRSLSDERRDLVDRLVLDLSR